MSLDEMKVYSRRRRATIAELKRKSPRVAESLRKNAYYVSIILEYMVGG